MPSKLLRDKIQDLLDTSPCAREGASRAMQDVLFFESVLVIMQEHCPERFLLSRENPDGN